MAFTKLVFGFQTTWDEVTLVVSGKPAARPPELMVFPRDGDGVGPAHTYAFDEASGTWRVKALPPGLYVVRMDVPEPDWFADTLKIDVVDDPPRPCDFVIHGSNDGGHETSAWTATSAIAGSDPKDPWPPPAAPIDLAPEVYDWFHRTLHDMREKIVVPRDFAL